MLQAIVEGHTGTMGAVDTDLHYLVLNRSVRAQLRQMYGRDYQPGDSVADGMSEEMAAASEAVWKRALAGETFLLEAAFGDQANHVYESTFYPLRDADGKIFGAAGWGRAVTEREQAYRDLTVENEELEAFAGMVAHDLRQPLAAVGGAVEIIDEVLEKDPAIARALLARIKAIITRTDDDIADLLDYARATGERLERSHVDLCKLTTSLLIEVSDTEIVEVADLPTLFVSEPLFAVALRNLLANSVKFAVAEHGGDASDPALVQVSAEHDTDGWWIHVDDNGPGIPESIRESVFDVGTTFHRDVRGTGMGLSAVDRVLRRHGGHATVTDSPLGGARVSAYVPHPPECAGRSAPGRASAPGAAGAETRCGWGGKD